MTGQLTADFPPAIVKCNNGMIVLIHYGKNSLSACNCMPWKIAFKYKGKIWEISASRPIKGNSRGSIKVIPDAKDTKRTAKQSKINMWINL